MKRKILYILLAALLLFALFSFASNITSSLANSNKQPASTKESVPIKPESQLQTAAAVSSEPKAGEKIEWQVLSSGGTSGSSTNFKMQGTVSQTAIGPGASTNFKLNSGFWQKFTTFVCDCKPGDANNSGNFNALDVTYIINFLYKHGPAPKPYALCSGDANSNCVINALDVTYMINFLYKHGPTPGDCATWVSHCGMPLRGGQ